MTPLEVVGLGAMNIDHLCRVKSIPVDGETVVEEIRSSPGGSAANTIYALAKLGIRTGFIGAVGDDEDGTALLADFNSVEVDTSMVRIHKNTRTGSALCISDHQGNRSIYVSPEANDSLSKQDINTEYINQARLIHLSPFVHPRQFEIQKWLIPKLKSSVKVSFAPGTLYATKGLKELAPLLKKTDILFVNHSEIELLTGRDIVTAARECLEMGCRIIVVTLGEGIEETQLKVPNGQQRIVTCYITDGNRKCVVEAGRQPAPVVKDTTGAGDAFAAGFIYGFLNSKGLQECGLTGDIAARYSMRQFGARTGLPSISELSLEYQSRQKAST